MFSVDYTVCLKLDASLSFVNQFSYAIFDFFYGSHIRYNLNTSDRT